jgi:hypothetical protein
VERKEAEDADGLSPAGSASLPVRRSRPDRGVQTLFDQPAECSIVARGSACRDDEDVIRQQVIID